MVCVSRSPMFCQVVPPSSERYTPSPQVELCRLFASPVPTHTTLGSLGAIAMSPIESAVLAASNTGSHVTPLLRLLNTPPEAEPTYMVLGSLGTASMSSTRPPNDAGPICRHAESGQLRIAACCAAAGGEDAI